MCDMSGSCRGVVDSLVSVSCALVWDLWVWTGVYDERGFDWVIFCVWQGIWGSGALGE